ncbi:Rv3654c family TadE-like protein [Granulicoccus phenolivorans]|uniref:Rv3654c family TadE-like protein n=1 Tax=Granulicoccus phenolivorans TaxID=266854 RepID=UPI0004103EBC|nr:Rv3654c family TadE-like protein [Granulicoccus phenolivorans]
MEPNRRGEHGSGTMLTVLLLALTMLIGGVAAVVVGYVVAAHRARVAADAVAFSVAAWPGAQSCRQAAPVAARNGARLVSCAYAGDEVDHVITVVVAVGVRPRPAGLPAEVSARAYAGTLQPAPSPR